MRLRAEPTKAPPTIVKPFKTYDMSTIFELRVYGSKHISAQARSIHSTYAAAREEFKRSLLAHTIFAQQIDGAEIFKLQLNAKTHEYVAVDCTCIQPSEVLR